MTEIVYLHLNVAAAPETLIVVDAVRRDYLGLSRDGTYLHHVRPARKDDATVGDGLVREGDLTCDCAAGRFGHHECYWTKRAAELELDRVAAAAASESPVALVEAFS